MTTETLPSNELFPKGIFVDSSLRDTLDGITRGIGEAAERLSPVEILHNLSDVPDPIKESGLLHEAPQRMAAIEAGSHLDALVDSAITHSLRYATMHDGLRLPPLAKEQRLEQEISWPVAINQRAALRRYDHAGGGWELEVVDIDQLCGGLVRAIGGATRENAVVFDDGRGEQVAHIGQLAAIRGFARAILVGRQHDRVRVTYKTLPLT